MLILVRVAQASGNQSRRQKTRVPRRQGTDRNTRVTETSVEELGSEDCDPGDQTSYIATGNELAADLGSDCRSHLQSVYHTDTEDAEVVKIAHTIFFRRNTLSSQP